MNNYLLKAPAQMINILTAAEKVIKEYGICSFKLSKLAVVANCSTKTVYRFFNSKEDVIVALFIIHVNELLFKSKLIINDIDLSDQQKIIYSMMYDPVKCWAADKNDLCMNFLGVNPHIYNLASPEYIGNLHVLFIEIKEHSQRLWRRVINNGELRSNKSDIINCIYLMRVIQRGAIAVGQNKFLRQYGHDTSIESTFDAICNTMYTLDWTYKCESLSYDHMFTKLKLLLHNNKEVNMNHYAIPLDTLKESIDL